MTLFNEFGIMQLDIFSITYLSGTTSCSLFFGKLQLNAAFFYSGKRAFIAGVADDNGYGWAIAKALAAAGAEILVGTWVPVSDFALIVILLTTR